MPGRVPPSLSDALHELLRSIEPSLVGEPGGSHPMSPDDIRSVLDRVEAATPGGAPLHAQLDTVRRWLGALEEPADHERFGGVAHLRQHVLMQVRLARGALEDYQRERTSQPERE